MEKKTGIMQVVKQAESTVENTEMLSETSRVSLNSTGIDWTADGTDNAGWTTKSYAKL